MIKLCKPVKGIFFDIGWTLSYPLSKDWFICNKMIECIDMDTFAAIPKNKKAAAFERALNYFDENHLLVSEDEELEQFKTFYSMLANDLPELAISSEQINVIACSKVSESIGVLFDDTLSTLDALKGRYKLGVISDTFPSVVRGLKSYGIYDYFDAKTFSCFLGTWKPDERMYLHALEQLSLPPEQTVFIDDGVKNLDGAAKCGIQPVLITAKPDAESSDKYPVIKKISELIDLLSD